MTKDTQCENKVFIQNMLDFLNEGHAKQRHANYNTAMPSETVTKVNFEKDQKSPNRADLNSCFGCFVDVW